MLNSLELVVPVHTGQSSDPKVRLAASGYPGPARGRDEKDIKRHAIRR